MDPLRLPQAVRCLCLLFTVVALQLAVPNAGALEETQQSAASVVPPFIRMSGVLRHQDGTPVSSPVAVRFALYASASGDPALWTESQNVVPGATGYYSAILGENTLGGLPLSVFTTGEAKWLGVQIESEVEQPRILLVSVPYAIKAGDAASLSGLDASAFVQWKDLQLLPPTSGTTTLAPASEAASTSLDLTHFLAKYADAAGATLTASALFDNGSSIGLHTSTPVAVLDIHGDGTAEIISATADADVTAGVSIRNSVQGWQLAVRPDLSEALTVRNATMSSDVLSITPDGTASIAGKLGIGTSSPGARLDVAGDIKLSSQAAGIVFPDGTRQVTASSYAASQVVAPDSVVVRDADGSVAANKLTLQSNLQLPVNGYIATSDAVDEQVALVPKLFLSADGGPATGVIPSLTFRSTNPTHMFGEVAFQDNTASPGQDIWAMQQDFLLNRTESLAFRRRGHPVLTFWPLSINGADVLSTFSGTRMRFERSGPYPIEYRDTSYLLPEGLWRTLTSQNCWLLDKNTSLSGTFDAHIPMLQSCPDGNLTIAAGLRINGGVSSAGSLLLKAQGGISLSTSSGQSIHYTPGANGFNVFDRPLGIGTSTPLASLHVVSGGNLQDGIFASSLNANEGISIRNTVQNWALGVRTDLGQSFGVRNITAGTDPLQITPAGTVTIAQGQLKAARGISIGAGVDANGTGLKHGRVTIAPVAQGATTAVELEWRTPFADSAYTATCSVVSTTSGLHLQNILAVQADALTVLVANEDTQSPQSGVLHCIAIHD